MMIIPLSKEEKLNMLRCRAMLGRIKKTLEEVSKTSHEEVSAYIHDEVGGPAKAVDELEWMLTRIIEGTLLDGIE